MDITPVFFVILTLRSEERLQFVGYLSSDIIRNLTDISVILQKASGYVQRNVRTIDHALQEKQKLRNDLLDVVCNKNLIAIELDLAFRRLKFVSKLGEVENPLEMEGIIHVQMNPEQRLLIVCKHLMIEFLVLFIGTVLGSFGP